MVELTDNANLRRFEMPVEGQTAFVTYTIADNRIVLLHTEVPSSLAGRGIGSVLIHAVLEEVRGRGMEVAPQCEFAAAYIHRHPEFAALVVPSRS
jgi:predicted GNAT family acetyltransferase